MTDQHQKRCLSLSGVGSRLIDSVREGYRRADCPRCGSVLGVKADTMISAPVECCVCFLVFFPISR